MNLTATITLDINGMPCTVTVHGTYYPGHDGRGYEPNEPAEMDIEYVRMSGGVVYPTQLDRYFTEEQVHEMEMELWGAHFARK